MCGVLVICDRLAGGAGDRGGAGAPFVALTTIDEVYPERRARPRRLQCGSVGRTGGLVQRLDLPPDPRRYGVKSTIGLPLGDRSLYL